MYWLFYLSRLVFPVFLIVGVSAVAGAQRIRVVAANTSSGNGQDYDGGHGIRIFQGVKADIILIQEFNYLNNTTAQIRGFVDDTFGSGFYYYRENGGSIPNGIISRFPILESGEWPSPVAERDFAWARIDLPGDRELLAVSVHLPTTDSQRPGEATLLVNSINQYYAANGGIRATDYLVVGGDFNTDTRTESSLNILGQIVTIGTVHPADRQGNPNTNAGRNKPYDAIYAGKGLHPLSTPVVITGAGGTSSTFPNGLVVDTRVYTPLQEIAPALAGDSGAAGMQHMAVVRDFQIPLPADPPVMKWVAVQFARTPAWEADLTFNSTAGVGYELQASSTMASAAWTGLGSFSAGGPVTTIRVVPSTPAPGQIRDVLLGVSPSRFYRVVRR